MKRKLQCTSINIYKKTENSLRETKIIPNYALPEADADSISSIVVICYI